VEIRTRHWGVQEVAEDRVIRFPEGIPGFPNCQRFVLLEEEGSAFLWLQAVDDPEVALPVADPFSLFPGYEVPLEEEDAEILGISDSRDVAVLVVVTVRTNPLWATVNLAAPILINTASRTGRQKILAGPEYAVRHPLVFR